MALAVVIRYMIGEVLGVVLDIDIAVGESVHRADKIADGFRGEGADVLEINTGFFGKGLCRIVSTQRHPVMVGTAIDGFGGMLSENRNQVNGFDTAVKALGDIVKIILLFGGVIRIVGREIEFTGKRCDHGIDIDFAVELTAKGIQRIYISIAAAAAEQLHRTVMSVLIDHYHAVFNGILCV